VGNCSAVGYYLDSSKSLHGLLLTETAGRWATEVKASLPADAAPSSPASGEEDAVGLPSVSCAAAGNCIAVGYYLDSSGNAHGLLLAETGGKWATGVQAALPANAVSNLGAGLSSVSCASAGNCSVVGGYSASSGGDGLLLIESGGRWKRGIEVRLPANAASNPGATLFSVSCASAGNCSAVGWYDDSSGNLQGLLLTETGGRWAPGVEAAPPANAASNPAGSLNSVSCASAGNCSAVGFYFDSSGNGQGRLLTETRGRWAREVEAALPANAGSDPQVDLTSVSCASGGNCSAVGSYFDSSGHQQGLLLTESKGRWATGVEAAPPANAGSDPAVQLRSVSCAPGGECSVVGSYSDTAGNQKGLLLVTRVALSGLRVSPKAFALSGRRVNGRCLKQTGNNRTRRRCTRPISLVVSYELNSRGQVSITFKRALLGRVVSGHCSAATRKDRNDPRCTRVIAVRGMLTRSGRQSINRFTLTGRLGGYGFRAGNYRLTASPHANGQAGVPQTTAVKITR
jgi:hypothetical protein